MSLIISSAAFQIPETKCNIPKVAKCLQTSQNLLKKLEITHINIGCG